MFVQIRIMWLKGRTGHRSNSWNAYCDWDFDCDVTFIRKAHSYFKPLDPSSSRDSSKTIMGEIHFFLGKTLEFVWCIICCVKWPVQNVFKCLLFGTALQALKLPGIGFPGKLCNFLLHPKLKLKTENPKLISQWLDNSWDMILSSRW